MSDVEDILGALGIEILGESENRKSGALEYKALCPYHHGGSRRDRKPAWYVNAETGEHICFGCGFHGTLQVVAYRLLDLTWDEAGAWLNDRTDIMARFAERDAWAKEDRGPRVQLAPINDARILAFDHPPEEALKARSITPDAAEAYEVRWDSRTNRWILPIRSEDGHLLGWQIKGSTKKDPFFRNFPMGVQKGESLFGLQVLSGSEEAGVVESPLDGPRLYSIGYEAVATYGATVTESQMELLIGHTRAVMVAMDNPYVDDAGRRSAYWMLGLDRDGKPLRKGQDYSKRIRMRFLNYTGRDEKDPGEMSAPVIRNCWNEARSSVWGPKAVLL